MSLKKDPTQENQFEFDKIYVLNLKNENKFIRSETNFDEIQKNTYIGLNWVGNYAVGICFTKGIKIISKNAPEGFLKSF